MGFLRISFSTSQNIEMLVAVLSKVRNFEIVGNWHDHRLASINKSGGALDGVAAKSISDDRLRNGNSYYARLGLRGDLTLEGQIRKSGILMSNPNICSEAILQDPTVRTVVDVLVTSFCQIAVEVG